MFREIRHYGVIGREVEKKIDKRVVPNSGTKTTKTKINIDKRI